MIKKTILSKAVSEGIKAANLSIPEPIQQQFITYIELLVKWNAVHNLTAIREPIEMVKKHLLDSLVLLPYFDNFCKSQAAGHLSVLDVGTGAGVPGILLALSRPAHSFILLDSNQKKIAFVQHVISCLEVTNAVAVCDRVEKYRSAVLFDWVVSRAFASLSDFVRLSGHLCKPDGRFVAMKGVIDSTEIRDVPPDYTIAQIAPLHVPGLTAERTLVFMCITQKENVDAK